MYIVGMCVVPWTVAFVRTGRQHTSRGVTHRSGEWCPLVRVSDRKGRLSSGCAHTMLSQPLWAQFSRRCAHTHSSALILTLATMSSEGAEVVPAVAIEEVATELATPIKSEFRSLNAKLPCDALAAPRPHNTGVQITGETKLATLHHTQLLIDDRRRPSLGVGVVVQYPRAKHKMCAPFEGHRFGKHYQGLKRLITEEAEWVCLFIASVSDPTPKELPAVAQQDADILEKLVVLETQLQGTSRLPQSSMNKYMRLALFNHLSKYFGRRLEYSKARVVAGGEGFVGIRWSRVDLGRRSSEVGETHPVRVTSRHPEQHRGEADADADALERSSRRVLVAADAAHESIDVLR